MSLSASEKVEVIRMVEESDLSIRRTLGELGISRSSFYRWYQRYQEGGPDALQSHSRSPRRFWNKLPESVKEQCLEIALQYPEKSPRELAWYITDEHAYFIFESSVYRILKSYDLITSPAYILLLASDSFHTPTKRINELWQTDFTYFKVIAGVGITCPRYWMTTRAISSAGNSPLPWAPVMSKTPSIRRLMKAVWYTSR